MGVMKTLSNQLNKVIEIFNHYRIAQGKTPYFVIFNIYKLSTPIQEIKGYNREPITTDEVIEFHKGLRKMRELKL